MFNTLEYHELKAIFGFKSVSQAKEFVRANNIITIAFGKRRELVSQGSLVDWLLEKRFIETKEEGVENITKTIQPVRELKKQRKAELSKQQSARVTERHKKNMVKKVSTEKSSAKTTSH